MACKHSPNSADVVLEEGLLDTAVSLTKSFEFLQTFREACNAAPACGKDQQEPTAMASSTVGMGMASRSSVRGALQPALADE